MRILAFVTEGVQIRRILEHIGVDAQAPPIAPARGPPLWDECDAQGADGAGQEAPIDPDYPRDLFESNRRLLLATHGTAALQLGRQVAAFDYPGALATLRGLLR